MEPPEFLRSGPLPHATPDIALLYTSSVSYPLEKALPLCQYVDMVCIYCGGETKVANSRSQRRNNQVWRRRQCLECKGVFTTHEAVDLSSALLVDKAGAPEPFISDLLFSDILQALAHREDRYTAAREVTSVVVRDLLREPSKPLFKPSQVSLAASRALARLDEQAWLRFTAEHPSLQG